VRLVESFVRVWAAAGAVAVLSLAGIAVEGQDTRQVTEPKIPAACVQLNAQLVAVGDKVAEADEQKLDTDRIQTALDNCKAGMAVELKFDGKKNAFLTGPLELRAGVTLLIDKGVTLFGSRDAAMYEFGATQTQPVAGGACGTSPAMGTAPTPAAGGGAAGAAPRAAGRGGCRPLISATNVKDAAIMGDGVIDGRGYAKILGRNYSWWEMARAAEPKNERYFSIRLLVASHADGLILYRITLHNSPNFHVSVNQTNGFTAWGVHLVTPTDKTLDARNTDGIDPGTSENITVTHSWIDNGDDNIAIKAGVTHMSVIDNHFYTGHGMSIGSETLPGQSFLLVDGLTEDHTTSGVRIKSNVMRGGPVHDLVYKNICMRDVMNPIAISPYYINKTTEPFEDPRYTGDKIPDYKRITLENIYDETPGDVLMAGLNDDHRTEVTLNNVAVKGITQAQVHLAFADVTLGKMGANFALDGKNVKVTGDAAVMKAGSDPCAGKFLPMR
jgi:polygalacturonase